MILLETSVKICVGALSSITGMSVLAAVESAAAPSGGLENHLTLASAAVGCVVVLWGCITLIIKSLLKTKDEQIQSESARADRAEAALLKCEQALRDELAARAKRAEGTL